MNIWVEYYKSHAQMKESAKWVPPDPSIIIHRRFFDKIDDARVFAKRMEKDGNMVSIKRDGML